MIALPPPLLPPPPPTVIEEPDIIDVIAVDIDPSENKSSKSSRRRHRSHSRTGSRDRELIIERERLIPVPVRVQPELETYRYVEGPRRYSPPSPPPPRRSVERSGLISGSRTSIALRDTTNTNRDGSEHDVTLCFHPYGFERIALWYI